ncbi:MAG: ribosome small subunit-dependent GTPase A [Clostridia bacterium]|nr:ribosome small subunit-dependent GTPase A [Clostridia bacterium]
METEGIIVRGTGGNYVVMTDSGDEIICPAKGVFRHTGDKPCAGDRVTVLTGPGAVLKSIQERKNILIRPPVSNVENLFITFAAAQPEPNLLNVDKLTCVCGHLGIKPVIVITKTDISPDAARKISDIYEKSGFKEFSVSPDEGADAVREYIRLSCRSGVTCFAGASGVGKSTLITRLFPELSLETGEISKKIMRGKNTTRAVELYSLRKLFGDSGGGFVADTPGFSLLDFVRFDFLDLETLPDDFPEFSRFIGSCRYTKCTHLCEDGCRICEAAARGEIPASRHESYVSIYGELKKKQKYR